MLGRMQISGRLLVFTLGGLIIGFGLGRATAPGPDVRSPGWEEPRGGETALAPGAATSRSEEAETPSPLDDPDSLAEIREMAERAVSWGASPKSVVRGLIGQMSHEELVSMLTSLTDYSPEELENVEDIHAFAERLAEVAMDGTLLPAEDLGPEVQNVSFTGEVMDDNSPVAPRRHFGPEQERIYATFPSSELEGARVMAKWTRMDDGKVILFRRYRINPGEDWSFVWVGTPRSGWEPGAYRVDFYSADEEMKILASGQHVIMP